VSTLVGSPDQLEAGIDDFRDNVTSWVKDEGGRGGILLIDRETGKGVAVTFWSDEENMRQSEAAANELRRRVSEEMQATAPPTVERFEVAVFDV
jgi:hypothetical protein